jgi:tRNA(Ser,Leu) C12 N-acetylase TAN1
MEIDVRVVMAQQFADDWLLVAMNDYETFHELMEEAESGETIALADKLREDWERLAEQVKELVEEKISPTASLFIGQWLQGQGQLPFDLIAREVMAKKREGANV